MIKIITLFTLILSITYFSQVVYTDIDPDQFLQSSIEYNKTKNNWL